MVTFEKAEKTKLDLLIKEHMDTLAYPLDSYMENKLLKGDFYGIHREGKTIGYCVIKEEILWYFYITKEFFLQSGDILQQLLDHFQIEKVTAITSDSLLLSILTDFETELINKEGCYFIDKGPGKRPANKALENSTFRLAEEKDILNFAQWTKDFYKKPKETVQKKALYLLEENGEILGCGNFVKGNLFTDCVSIGMITKTEHRGKGVAKEILYQLKQVAYKQGLKPVAGCWYYNTLSRKSLEGVNLLATSKEVLLKVIQKDNLPAQTGDPSFQ